MFSVWQKTRKSISHTNWSNTVGIDIYLSQFDQTKNKFFEKQTYILDLWLETNLCQEKFWIKMEFTGNSMGVIETVMSESDILMPPNYIHRTTSVHSNSEFLANEINNENDAGNFEPNADVELVDAVGRRKRKRMPSKSRSRSQATKKRRIGVASRTRSRSERGKSTYMCSVCGANADQNSKKTTRSKKK